jgi:hypothetical protein
MFEHAICRTLSAPPSYFESAMARTGFAHYRR